MKCKSCDAEIRFMRTVDGAAIPLNYPPLQVFIIREGKAHKTKGYLPHWSTCPSAEKYKKKNTAPRGQTDLFGD